MLQKNSRGWFWCLRRENYS